MDVSFDFRSEGIFSGVAIRISEALAELRKGVSVDDILSVVCPDYDENSLSHILNERGHDDASGVVDLTHGNRRGGHYGYPGYGSPVINCYPGLPANFCADQAVFISIQGGAAKGRDHYNFAEALAKMIQHLQGACSGKTKAAALITNTWNYDQYTQWIGNIQKIRASGVDIEFYLLCGKRQVARLHI